MKISEMRRLGDFATWRAARAVGDHDLNTFSVRADPVGACRGAGAGRHRLDRGSLTLPPVRSNILPAKREIEFSRKPAGKSHPALPQSQFVIPA